MTGKPPKAIQTRFASCFFRSRLEARYAVMFDKLGIAWEYEREGFELPGGRYLPDFWLSQVRMWGEVKPEAFTPEETRKAIELVAATHWPVLCLEGVPANKGYAAWEEIAPGIIERPNVYLITCFRGYPAKERRFYANPAEGERFDDTQEAVDAALSARFEFEETLHPAMNALINLYAGRIKASENPWAEYEVSKQKIVAACQTHHEQAFVLRTLSQAAGL